MRQVLEFPLLVPWRVVGNSSMRTLSFINLIPTKSSITSTERTKSSIKPALNAPGLNGGDNESPSTQSKPLSPKTKDSKDYSLFPLTYFNGTGGVFEAKAK